MNKKTEILMMLSAGDGPEECSLFVAKALSFVLEELPKLGNSVDVVYRDKGLLNGTVQSAVVKIKTDEATEFKLKAEWQGTWLWVCKSPFRKFHKRKNWFIGCYFHEIPEQANWREDQVEYQATRSSGPGGQHVNKTNSAIRATHIPSGISVLVQDQRSQFQNKKLALQRLKEKCLEINQLSVETLINQQWKLHHSLERGNPKKTFHGIDLMEI